MKEQTSEKELSTEQKILETAERLFLDRGLALVSTTEIAREAGCNQALVHYYFRTKENLFQKIFEEKMRLFASLFFKIDEEYGTFKERLTRKIETHFEALRKNPKLAFLLVNEITTNPTRMNSIRERVGQLPVEIMASFQADLNTEIQAGNIRNISLLDFLMNILFLNVATFIFSPVFQSVTDASPEEMEALYEHRKKENVETILRSLRP
jgi:AcrR family transcriptional regulator